MFSKFLALLVTPAVIFAASPAIGIITASGHFTLERSRVWGNSTLFEGATVETDSASSELSLGNGVKVQLAAGSRARVWANRMTLEKGVGQVAASGFYEVDAGGLKIRSEGDAARFQVGLRGRVEVTSLSGSARVATATGALLAAIPAGRSAGFAMQAQAAAPVMHSGCLLFKDGRFILQDDRTQEVIELSGRDLAANTGNRVSITGTSAAGKPTVTLATSLVNVASLTTTSQGGCLSVASALDARTEVPATAAKGGGAQPAATQPGTGTVGGGGLSTGAKVAIAAVVAGGGAGAAIALAGKKGSTSP